ncbi:MAG: hypothetical protein AABY15_07005 [Nanoarchaeota archaeon]
MEDKDEILNEFNKMSDSQVREFAHHAVISLEHEFGELMSDAEFLCKQNLTEEAIFLYKEAFTHLMGQILFMQIRMLADHCDSGIKFVR